MRPMIMSDMTSDGFAAGLEKTRTAILPLGSLEEHGAHLPLSTDTMHMEALAHAAAEEIDVFVAPAIPYGLCRSTSDHPGTVSIGFDTVRAVVKDVGESLYRQGIRRLIVATGHAGMSHQAAMIEAAEDLQRSCPELVAAVVSVVDLLIHQVADVLSTPDDSHAGELETSIVLHLAPDLVRRRSPKEKPKLPFPILVRNKTAYWPGGVNGDPTAANEAKGAEVFDRGRRALVELIRKVNAFEEA